MTDSTAMQYDSPIPPSTTAIPSPLPFVVSILPLLLSSSDVTLPPALLSPSVLQRHYYLSLTSDTPSTYLQATADSAVQDAVENRREALASTWLEDVKLSEEDEILYSRTIHEEHKLVASITLKHGTEEDISLVLLIVWEVAPVNADSESSNPQSRSSGEILNNNSDNRHNTQESVIGHEEGEESSWKFYDLQLPTSRGNMNKKAWSRSIREADATLAHTLEKGGTSSMTARSQEAESSTSAHQRREKLRLQQEATRGLQGEEGPDLDPEDYWAGVESSEDEMGDAADAEEPDEADNEDNYWNSYGEGANSPEDKGSIVDSGHQGSELEDSTMRYNADFSENQARHEYTRNLEGAGTTYHTYDYSFESERGLEDSHVPERRILVDNFDTLNRAEQNGDTHNDSFINALQSSLERVSSSQSASSDEDNGGELNGHINGVSPGIAQLPPQVNGHAAHAHTNGHVQSESPTFDSAIQKSIAGIWETFLISSASGGGGKNREIAAYEFMELVRGVVEG